MQLNPIPLFTPLRTAVSLAIGGWGSWRLHAAVHAAWSEAFAAGNAGGGARLATAVHWALATYSLILTVAAVWLVLTLGALLWRAFREGRSMRSAAPSP